MTAAIAAWFRIPVVVRRLTGESAYGPIHDAGTEHLARVSMRSREIRAPNGETVVAAGRISLAIDTPPIPPGSLVQLPQRYGDDGRWRRVLAWGRHEGGTALTPDYTHLDIDQGRGQ